MAKRVIKAVDELRGPAQKQTANPLWIARLSENNLTGRGPNHIDRSTLFVFSEMSRR